jgi:hypothetical protein
LEMRLGDWRSSNSVESCVLGFPLRAWTFNNMCWMNKWLTGPCRWWGGHRLKAGPVYSVEDDSWRCLTWKAGGNSFALVTQEINTKFIGNANPHVHVFGFRGKLTLFALRDLTADFHSFFI